jgi:serine protease Do
MHSATQLRNTIGLTRIGDEVNLTLERSGREQSVGVKVELAQQAAPTRPRVRQQ